MPLSLLRMMLAVPQTINFQLSTTYRLIRRVKRFTPCVAMHNINRFNEVMQANQGLLSPQD